MSELKAYRFLGQDEVWPDANLGSDYYLKSEADKVIADLEESHKMEVEQLLILNREQANAANRLRDSMEQVIRHSKYKRCLAMAYVEWLKQMTLCDHPESILYRSAARRERKWKEMAETFKEA